MRLTATVVEEKKKGKNGTSEERNRRKAKEGSTDKSLR